MSTEARRSIPSRGSSAGSSLRLTGRGAIVLVLVFTILGQTLAGFFEKAPLTGIFFVVGCLLAVNAIRPRDLLTLVVTPPLVFFVATLIVEVFRAWGEAGMFRQLTVAMFTTLSSGAPWLFLGTALVLLIAVPRGLPANIRELREEMGARQAQPQDPEVAPDDPDSDDQTA